MSTIDDTHAATIVFHRDNFSVSFFYIQQLPHDIVRLYNMSCNRQTVTSIVETVDAQSGRHFTSTLSNSCSYILI